MSKQEININGLQPGGNTLTILEGKALEQKYPEKIKLSGNIESVSQFLSKRYGDRQGKGLQEVDKEKAVVVVDEEAMDIVLSLDPENHFGLEVTASLEHTPDLLTFHINEVFTFTRESMIKLLKFSKRFFASPNKQEELLEAYMKLNLSGSTTIKAESDDRGNKDFAFQKSIQSQNIPKDFVLEMPIFKGQAIHKFRVDICLEATDGSVRFWFESVELTELIELTKKDIFAKQLESCADFVIIHR